MNLALAVPPASTSARLALLLSSLGAGFFAFTRLWTVTTGVTATGVGVTWFIPDLLPQLALFLCALAAVILLWRLAEWRLKKSGLPQEQARDLAARSFWPAALLGLVPAAELFSPLYPLTLAPLAISREAWPLLLLAVVLCLGWQLSLAGGDASGPKEQTPRFRAWTPWVVFVLTLVACAIFGMRLTLASREVGRFMGGDEPQYLFNAHTLAVDHDLDLANNVLLRENLYFLDPWRVIGGHASWSRDKKFISKHRPGLPLLTAPFYAWGLYSGIGARKASVICIWLLTAWMCTEVFLLCRSLCGREPPALAAALATAMFLPGVHYSNLMFPEMAAAAFSIAAFRRVRQAELRQWHLWLIAGCLTGYLAWFHERFIALALILGCYALWRGVWRNWRSLAAFFLPCLLSAGVLMRYFMALYNRPFPTSSIHAQGSYLNPRGAWEGLSGLLFDAAEGLLPYGAIWLAALAGLVWLLRKKPAQGVWVGLMGLTTYVTAGLYADWFGGINPPCRYLVAAIPFLAVGLSAGLNWGRANFKQAGIVLAVLAYFSLAHVMKHPAGVYGHAVRLGAYFQFPLVENLLPTFIVAKTPAQNGAIALIWMTWAGLMAALLQRGNRRFAPGRAAAGLFAVLALFVSAAIASEAVGPGLIQPRSAQHIIRDWSRQAEMGPALFTWQSTDEPPRRELNLSPVRYRHGKLKLLGDPPTAIKAMAERGAFLAVWGQYLTLPPGAYRAEVELQSSTGGPQTVADLDVAAELGKQVLAKTPISADQAKTLITLPFELDRTTRQIECRLGVKGAADLTISAMRIVRE